MSKLRTTTTAALLGLVFAVACSGEPSTPAPPSARADIDGVSPDSGADALPDATPLVHQLLDSNSIDPETVADLSFADLVDPPDE